MARKVKKSDIVKGKTYKYIGHEARVMFRMGVNQIPFNKGEEVNIHDPNMIEQLDNNPNFEEVKKTKKKKEVGE